MLFGKRKNGKTKIRSEPKKKKKRNRKPILETRQERISFAIILLIILLLNTVKIALASNGVQPVLATKDTGTKNLSATFLDIIKCGGKVAFLFGFVEFANSISSHDGGAMLPPIRKMAAGLVCVNMSVFLKSSKVYDAISGGTAVDNIGQTLKVINAIANAAVGAYGAILLVRGIMELGSAIGDRDIVSMKRSLLVTVSGIIAVGAAALATAMGI